MRQWGFLRGEKGRLTISGCLAAVTLAALLLFAGSGSAVQVSISGPGSAIAGQLATFRVNIVFATNERIPLDHLEVIAQGPDSQAVAGIVKFSVEGRTQGFTQPSFLKSITVVDASLSGYGYGAGSGTFKGYGYGYGYAAGSGYGTSGYGGSGNFVFNPATGAGYGYVSGQGTLSYDLVVDTAPMSLGTYQLTARVVLPTGSSATGSDFQSPSIKFQVSGGGGGGSGGSGSGSAGSAAVGSVTVTGSTASTTVTGTAGQTATIDVSGLSTGTTGVTLGTLTLTLGDTLSAQAVTVTASSAPTDGAISIPSGFGASVYLSISAGGSGAVSGGSFTFTLSDAALNGQTPSQVVLMHFKNGAWVPLVTTAGPKVNGQTTFTAVLDSFSPFAIAFDTQPPTIGAVTPADGATVPQKPLISAQVADNRGINAQATTMKVDGQPVAANVASGAISYTPSAALADGPHTVQVTATDLSGFTATKSWSFTSKAGLCTGPTVTIESPPDGSATTNKLPTIRATFTSPSCSVDPSTVTVQLDGASLTATATASGVTVTPTSALADGAHTVRVAASDTAGNGNFATASFTVDTAKPALSGVSPADGSTVDARPTLSASCSDALSGMDASGVTLLLDGVKVAATLANGKVTYTPGSDLPEGKHTAQLTCTDKAGNSATQSWSFTTQGGAAGGAFPWTMLIVVVLLLVVVGGAGYWYMYMRKPGAPPPK